MCAVLCEELSVYKYLVDSNDMKCMPLSTPLPPELAPCAVECSNVAISASLGDCVLHYVRMCAVGDIALTLSIPKTVCVYYCRIYLCNSLQCTYLVCAVTMVSVTSLAVNVLEYCIVCFMSVVVISH